MESNNENKPDFEINIRFIESIRENISKNDMTKNVKVFPRNEDNSQYIVDDEDNILLSFTNY